MNLNIIDINGLRREIRLENGRGHNGNGHVDSKDAKVSSHVEGGHKGDVALVMNVRAEDGRDIGEGFIARRGLNVLDVNEGVEGAEKVLYKKALLSL